MYGKINIINPEAFISAIHDYTCGKTYVAEIKSKDIELKQEDTKPLDGYEAPKNFPHCCPNHENLLKVATDYYNKFPNCCDRHKKLLSAKWFKKDDYAYLPLKILNTFQYTFHTVNKCMENANWYKEITDYIEYTKLSYGQLPDGYGGPVGLQLYLYNVERNLENIKEIPKDKKKKLISFVKRYSEPKKEVDQTDFNILIGIYKKWLKEFPFELSFFKQLKPHYEKQMPILEGKGETNLYTGLTGFKVKTKESLIDFLVSITESIIASINTLTLYEQGLITDAGKLKLELIIESRKMKLKEGYSNKSPNDEHRYRKILKEWFKDEKEFMDEIMPLLAVTPIQKAETKAEKLKTELSKYGFFDLAMVKEIKSENKEHLIDLLCSNELPYCIAMFDFLGYLKHLEKEHFQAKYKLYKEISRWFNSDKTGRAVKGHISSLHKKTTENKKRYTAHLHKEKVQNDYQKLK